MPSPRTPDQPIRITEAPGAPIRPTRIQRLGTPRKLFEGDDNEKDTLEEILSNLLDANEALRQQLALLTA